MDIQTLTMDQEQAAEAFRVYRGAFMAERNRIDGELMRGYKALVEGKTLISLAEAVRSGGVDDLGRPHLAVARADESAVSFARDSSGNITYYPTDHERATAADRVFSIEGLPSDDRWPRTSWRTWNDWTATLPFIPPQYRPPHGLVGYHLLWEATWRQRQRKAQTRDPLLLKHIGGDLFAVLAAWDLTEVEKLVLAR